jgi:regulator of sirC expression with transglutaminase-like and TPR domain
MKHSPLTEFALLARAPDDTLDLEALCASIARMRDPAVDPGGIAHDLDLLAEDLQDRLPGPRRPDQLAAALRRELGGRLDFRGSQEGYDRLDSSMLDRVLKARRGLPILLSVVWMLVGRRLGLPIAGVNAPGHFLVCLDLPGARIYLDPFAGGEEVSAAMLMERVAGNRAALVPASSRPIVTRVLTNLKHLGIDKENWQLALDSVDRIQLISGDHPTHTRDRGLLCLRLERRAEAARELRRYLQQAPEAPERREVERLLRELEDN